VTLNVLESFLLDFPGCLIVVSHDRYFMDKIVDHLFVFRGNAVVEDFPGNYSDFRAYEDSNVLEKRAEKEKIKAEKQPKNTWKESRQEKKLSYQEQKEYKQLEKDIQKLEFKKGEIEQRFVSDDLDGTQISELSHELKTIIEGIELKTERWFELSALLE